MSTKRNVMQRLNLNIALAAFVTLGACEDAQGDYTAVSFQAEGNRLIATGVIDATTMERFKEARAANPEANILVLQNIPGSVDDEANLVFSRAVRESGFTTLVPSDGMVASGGTDLFLAGKERILEEAACVGVHSWAAGEQEGSNLPRDHPEHQIYLDYYDSIGIDRAFYWFTLEAAPAAGNHWVTTAEANQYGMTTTSSGQLGQGAACDAR